jgi:methylase of polypeptide subunit release factors
MFELSHKASIHACVGVRTVGRVALRHAGPMIQPLAQPIAAPRGLVALGHILQAARYRFVTVTPATHRRVDRRPENAWAEGVRGVLGWSRPFRPGVLPPDVDAALRAAGLVEPAGEGERARVRASTIGEHLYFHSPWPTSDADAVFFGPDTYRYVAALQRSLDELARESGRPVRRAVDIGAGAGPGAIELALRHPEAVVYATDVNPQALALAQANAELNGAANVVVCASDLLDGLDGEFDLVMSNPPYILDPDQLTYRHGGGEHGAELSIRMVRAALDRLAPGGSLMLYTGVAIVDGKDAFLAHVRAWLERDCARWRYEELDPDIFGEQLDCEGYEQVERIAAVWLHAVKRG